MEGRKGKGVILNEKRFKRHNGPMQCVKSVSAHTLASLTDNTFSVSPQTQMSMKSHQDKKKEIFINFSTCGTEHFTASYSPPLSSFMTSHSSSFTTKDV